MSEIWTLKQFRKIIMSEVAEIKQELEKGLGEIKSNNAKLAESFNELDLKIKKGEEDGKVNEAAYKANLEKIDGIEKTADSLKKTVNDLVEKMSDTNRTQKQNKSIGELAAEGLAKEGVDWQNTKGEVLCKSNKGLHQKDITGADASAGHTYEPTRVGYKPPQDMPLTIRDLLTTVSVNSDSVEWFKQKLFTNNAAPQENQGDTKAQSDLTFEKVNTPVETLAHWFGASRQVLNDSSRLRDMINGRGTYGLKLVEDSQILKGDGTGGNLSGLITEATAYVATASESRIDAIRRAIVQAESSYLPSTGIVLHPTDWAEIELLKDANGNYIFARAQDSSAPRLWGRRVVTSYNQTVGDFLTGSFAMGATLFDREQMTVRMSESHESYFIKNMIAILIEERLALAVEYPDAFITGTFA